jgi:hypothetical protein
MSDVPPPPDSQPEAGGLWHRYRSLPLGLQILAPLVVLAVIVGGIAWATSGSDGDVASTETTTASGDSSLDVVIKGLIVAGGLTDSSVPTTGAAASTSEPTSTSTTGAPTTAAPSTTTSSTSVPATTAPAGPVAPTTSARPTTIPPTTIPPTTAAPTTSEPGTTEPPATEPPDTVAPGTTEPPATTEAPTTTAGANRALPSVATFFAQWNDAAAGTDVPTISSAEARELTGGYAGYYVIPLTVSGSTLPPQVGLVGKVTAPGSGQLDEVMLVWIPGSDEGSSAFYWDCFGVLVQAVSPGAAPDEIADLASALGQAPDTPPFTGTANMSSGGLDYHAFTLPYTGEAGTLDVSAIEIS